MFGIPMGSQTSDTVRDKQVMAMNCLSCRRLSVGTLSYKGALVTVQVGLQEAGSLRCVGIHGQQRPGRNQLPLRVTGRGWVSTDQQICRGSTP